MIDILNAYAYANDDNLCSGSACFNLDESALTNGTLNPQSSQIRDGGYSPPPITRTYTPQEIDGDDNIALDNYLSEGSAVSINLSSTSTCVNLATGYDTFNFGYQLLIKEEGQVLDRIDTFRYNNTFNIVCSSSFTTNRKVISSTATYSKMLSGTTVDLLPVGSYRRTTSPNDVITLNYYLPTEYLVPPVFWPNELLNVYKTKKIVWDMSSIRLGGEDLKNTFIPFKRNETTYVVDQPRDLSLYTINDYISTRVDYSLSAVQLGNTVSDYDITSVGDHFGNSVDTNDEGTRIVVGAPYYVSSVIAEGLVRTYELIDSNWVKIGQDLVGERLDEFGWSVSMNGDGNRIAVGAYGANGVGSDTGETKIYEWDSSQWVQIGQTIAGANISDWSGYSVQLNSAGDRIVIGERFGDAGGYESGQVRVYQYNGSIWVQMGEVIAGGAELDEVTSTAINSTGDIIIYGSSGANLPVLGYPNVGVVRAYMWDGNQWKQIGQDIYGDGDFYLVGYYGLSINSIGDILAVTGVQFGGNNIVRVYKYDGTSWNQINAFYGTETTNTYGYSISLNSAGDRIAISDRQRLSNRGAVDVYEYNGIYWEKIIVDIEGPFNGASYVYFGESVSLNNSGDRLVVGAPVISGGQVRNYQLPQYPLVGLSSYSAYKSVMLWSDGVVTENPFIYPFYLPDNTYGSSAGVINFRKFTTPGEYTILSNTFYYRNSLNKEIILTEPYNITFVVS